MNVQQILRAAMRAAIIGLVFASIVFFVQKPKVNEARPTTLQGQAAIQQLKQGGQYESLQTAINQARFGVSHKQQTPLGRPAWQAPNSAAGYDAYVTEEGVTIAVNDKSYVSLRLQSLGYGNTLKSVAAGEVSGGEQTINLVRDGGVREWYVNGPDGLEHGFTLSEPPGMRQQGVPLRLALQVGTGWRAQANQTGESVTLRGPDDQTIEYSKLVVHDNQRHTIPARLTVADEQVVIEAEDHNAEYPLTIDPLFTLQQRLSAQDGAAGDYLGYSVALDGNTAVLGAPYAGQTRGSAYVFVRNGATWTQQAHLIANDGAIQDYFGWSVAVKGDTAVVGALYAPGNFDSDQGAAYVFVRNGTTWTQQARLNANENLQGAQFASALALDGNTVLVGTPAYTITPSFATAGAVFVFTRNGTTWAQQARLLASDGGDNDNFGVTVALEGDMALVGAPNNAVTMGGQGAAYAFTRSGTTWTQQPRLLAVQPAADDHFGNAVAISGNTALIGAYQKNFGNGATTIADCGAVYAFTLTAQGWSQVEEFFPPNPAVGGHFGVSLAVSGDTAVVGASLGLFQTGTELHSAYVFERLTDWEVVRQFGPELGATNDGFGYAVALSGDTVLVGAYRADAAAADQGAAFAFVLHDSRHIGQQKLIAPDGATFDQFGNAVALDGDTLVIGAQLDDVGANGNQGSAYVFTRNGTTWTFQQKLNAPDGATDDWFGRSVTVSGNTAAIGSHQSDIGMTISQGAVYVFTRQGTTWTFQQKLTANDGARSDLFGVSVALENDTLVAGAYQASVGTNGLQGAAYVFTRTGATWMFQQKLTANDGAVGDQFGYSVSIDGDTVAVGAFGDTIGGQSQQGSAYIFTRNGTTWTQQQKLVANDGLAQDRFGGAIAVSGDTVVIGAFQCKIGANLKQGAAYIFLRTGSTWAQASKLTANDGQTNDLFGYDVALDADQIVVGTRSDSQGRTPNPGMAYVFTRLGNWVQQQKLIPSDGATLDYFGAAVAISGNTIVAGALSNDIGLNSDQGGAYVFASPSCPALTIGPNSLPNGVAGITYNQQFTGSGSSSPGDYVFSVSRGTLPPGMILDQPGLLHGIPIAPGTYRFTITTTFVLSGCTGNREYTVTILPCPAITVGPPTLPNGVLNAAYSQEVTATGGGGQHSFAVTAGALPPGLSLSPLGTLSGTPSQAGNFNFTVTATSNTCTGSRAYTLTILPTCPAFTVNPQTMPNGRVGVAYSQTVTVTGGVAPYTFAIRIGSTLPPGMSYINGVLSGTPTQAGAFGFITRIKDANGCQVDQGYSVTINPPCEPFTINPGTLPNGTTGAMYNQTLSVSVTTLAASFAVTAGTLPPGLSLSASGTLSGAPTQAGSFPFTVTATTNGCTGTQAYTLTIHQNGSGLQFYPLAHPVRLLDTRVGATGCDAPGVKIAGNTSRTQTAAGRTCDGLTIPANASALVGNATSVQSGGGYFTLYPSDIAKPNSANSNYAANQILNSLFTVRLGASDGAFKIFASTDTDIVVDITGYYAPPSATGLYFHPLPKPVRLLDTRPGASACFTPETALQGDSATSQIGTTICDGALIPTGAMALVGNATTVSPQANGFLTLYPADSARPLIASANFQPGVNLNSPFMVGLSPSGQFNIYVASTTDLVIDVTGYYSTQLNDSNGQGLLLTALTAPVHLLDTRTGQSACSAPATPMTGGTPYLQPATGVCSNIPAAAQAVVGNATTVNPTANGYLTFWPSTANQPFIATSNYRTGITFNRHFTVGLGNDGGFKRYAASTTDLVIDLVGYFAPGF